MYKFKLPVGDWSSDGHGECIYYTVVSNKSVEDVREVHFKIIDTTGIDIHAICAEYEDYNISPELKTKLEKLGFEMEGTHMEPDEMCRLWLHLLMVTDSSLNLSLVEEEKIPMLPFYGYDNKKRHISFVGYGCF